jgi:cytoskeletal protein RodZ
MHPGFGNDGGFFGGDIIFQVFPMMFGLVFIIVFGIIIYTVFANIKQWNHNNKQPILKVAAIVVTKRSKVSSSSTAHNNHLHPSSSTDYFVTFEVESGDRMEFVVTGNEYGQLADGDRGRLQFQGTRYQGFERI